MKIVQVCHRFPPSLGGVENYVYNLSYELSLRGHEIVVLTSDIQSSSFFKTTRTGKPYEKIRDNFEVYRFKTYPPDIPYANTYAMIPAIIQKLQELKPDVINTHSHALLHSDVVSLFSKIKKIPTVLTIHSSGNVAPRPYTSLFLKYYNPTIGKLSLNCVSEIIVTSSQTRDFFSQFIDSKKISIIPLGIDAKYLLPRLPSDIFKMKYALDKKVVLFVGRIVHVKGIQHLIKTIPDILKKISASFVIVGDGDDPAFEKKLRDECYDLGVADDVVFTGRFNQNELLDAYSSADVFVLPSLREGLSIVTLEALASKVPVVASNVGGLPSIVKNGITGFLVEPKNEQQLTDSILKILLDEDLAHEMGNNAQKVARNYEWSIIAEQIESIYKNIID